jgi:lipid A 3-O-deacylase
MKCVFLALLLMLAHGLAWSGEPRRAVAVDIGESDTRRIVGRTDFDLYRLGLQRDFSRVFWHGARARLGGYWEASLNYWDGRDDEVFAVALSPVFALYFGGESARYQPYVEAGVGVSLLSDHRIGGRELSTRFQFEDRIGIGVRMESFDVHYRYMHYSNGGIDRPNNGVNAHILGMTFTY